MGDQRKFNLKGIYEKQFSGKIRKNLQCEKKKTKANIGRV